VRGEKEGFSREKGADVKKWRVDREKDWEGESEGGWCLCYGGKIHDE